MSHKPARVLVVDDSVLYRKVLSEILSTIPGIEVVGIASNGKIALSKVALLKPDIMTLDFEMPEMDGLETLRQLKRMGENIAVVMVSSFTSRGAAVTIEALQLGAFDFLTKPEGYSPEKNREQILSQLKPIINAIITKATLRGVLAPEAAPPRATGVMAGTAPSTPVMPPPVSILPRRVEILAIGVSTGGPNALAEVIPCLPADFRVPTVIVQHMPPVFTEALAETLNGKSAVRVLEGKDGMKLEPGTVYIAPGGKQMKVVRPGDYGPVFLEVNSDPPENHCQPSVDYLFRSIAKVYGRKSLGVIMTGMGADGVRGLREMKQQGAFVIAQNEASCVVFGMPMEAIKAGVTDVTLPLKEIPREIVRLV